MNIPPTDGATYAILKNLSLYDAPEIGAKFLGVIPGGIRVNVVKWSIDKDETVWACIGGHPAQWLRAYHNQEKNINYIGGDE